MESFLDSRHLSWKTGHHCDSIVWLSFVISTTRVVASVVIGAIVVILVVALDIALIVVVLASGTTRLKPLISLSFSSAQACIIILRYLISSGRLLPNSWNIRRS